MNNSIHTFSIALPVDGELLNVTLVLFCGKPVQNRKKNFTYSIVCKADGMRIKLLTGTITANYGKGSTLTDCPVVKENEFIFSNECSKPVALRIKAEIKALHKTGATIFSIFTIDVTYTLQDFRITNASEKHSIKKEPGFLQTGHAYSSFISGPLKNGFIVQ